MKLQDQVALITGAAFGLGKAQALLFAKEGAKIIAADTNLAGAEATAEIINENGGNAIAVGLIEIPMVIKLIENKDSGTMETLKKLPAGRHGQLDEIANTALFLASDDSRYIYGAIIPVDGGLLSTLR